MANGDSVKKNKKWELAIAALLTTPTIKEAAEKCGMGENTLLSWLKIPEFAEQYKEAKRQVLDVAINRLQTIAGEAVECLRDVLTNQDNPASARVSAAKSVLELSAKAVEIEDISTRLDELEKTITKG